MTLEEQASAVSALWLDLTAAIAPIDDAGESMTEAMAAHADTITELVLLSPRPGSDGLDVDLMPVMLGTMALVQVLVDELARARQVDTLNVLDWARERLDLPPA